MRFSYSECSAPLREKAYTISIKDVAYQNASSGFRVFSKQGSMSHGLNKPIPGATELLEVGFPQAAPLPSMNQLRGALLS